ncbi:FAD/NAD(P)-binding domain-containing protein [Trichoderma citrinoviride]|uniref:FAD/NAD(P)-binding domain-containing protein n=1 Tax=Trichoderma citrinoviride TaxID=58853 RepID=A0A2T4BMF6_9HYPO|nr:FAD/NAD(P)-binding domain-containing protein [Trichoderma citrinoviride]PTB70461.1 FAD/NAD(P)-binding domain-containing protein [Trichoderma citrinoviride]
MDLYGTGKGGVGNNVCVVGTGVTGLLAVKNLVEQGLNVRALEQNEYLGGNWHHSVTAQQVSALPEMKVNMSKETNSFTDFPMPDDYPSFPSAQQIGNYLEAYADKFELIKHIELSTAVTSIRRDEEDGVWVVATKHTKTGDEEEREYDRVVLATGALNVMNVPEIKGIENFAGDAIHSRDFKDPSRYAGKNVLVVGLGSTGADTLSFLENAGANKLYLSSRSRCSLIPRTIRGRPWDHYMTRRRDARIRTLLRLSPSATNYFAGKAIGLVQSYAFPTLRAHPCFSGAVSGPLYRSPFVCDDLPELLDSGRVKVYPGIMGVAGPRTVVFKDGSEITDVDAIIFCCGYYHDLSLIEGEGHPADAEFSMDAFEELKAAKYYTQKNQYQRLYHGILSERYPESLAVLGSLTTLRPTFVLYDLATMALASMWSGSYPLPSPRAMKREIDSHYNFVVRALQNGPLAYLGLRIDFQGTYAWLNSAAGTGVIERLEGWGWEAWKFWWKNRTLYKFIMDGPNVSAVYRLFDIGRGRKPWAGAQAAIEKANQRPVERVEEIQVVQEVQVVPEEIEAANEDTPDGTEVADDDADEGDLVEQAEAE